MARSRKPFARVASLPGTPPQSLFSEGVSIPGRLIQSRASAFPAPVRRTPAEEQVFIRLSVMFSQRVMPPAMPSTLRSSCIARPLFLEADLAAVGRQHDREDDEETEDGVLQVRRRPDHHHAVVDDAHDQDARERVPDAADPARERGAADDHGEEDARAREAEGEEGQGEHEERRPCHDPFAPEEARRPGGREACGRVGHAG